MIGRTHCFERFTRPSTTHEGTDVVGNTTAVDSGRLPRIVTKRSQAKTGSTSEARGLLKFPLAADLWLRHFAQAHLDERATSPVFEVDNRLLSTLLVGAGLRPNQRATPS